MIKNTTTTSASTSTTYIFAGGFKGVGQDERRSEELVTKVVGGRGTGRVGGWVGW